MTIVLRGNKGSALTHNELDGNFQDLDGNKLDVNPDVVDFNTEYDNGTISADATINWANGDKQIVTLGADVTLSFSNMGVGHKQLRILQDGTGGRLAALPVGKWPGGTAGELTPDAGAEDILSVYYNGTNYYFMMSNDWKQESSG